MLLMAKVKACRGCGATNCMFVPNRRWCPTCYAEVEGARNVVRVQRDPQAHRARSLFGYHVRVGNIIRPAHCSDCGQPGRIQGHHTDYSKPLDVVWLCQRCHRRHDLMRVANAVS